MPSKTNHREAQEYYERVFGERPAEPHNTWKDPEMWAEIAEWEHRRAEFFSYVLIYDDCENAGRMVQ